MKSTRVFLSPVCQTIIGHGLAFDSLPQQNTFGEHHPKANAGYIQKILGNNNVTYGPVLRVEQ
jgi:hypothetical protein